MGVVALTALFEDVGGVFVNIDEGLLLMTAKAAADEAETPPAAYPVTVSTVYRSRWMHPERFKLGSRIFAHKETDFLTAPLPT